MKRLILFSASILFFVNFAYGYWRVEVQAPKAFDNGWVVAEVGCNDSCSSEDKLYSTSPRRLNANGFAYVELPDCQRVHHGRRIVNHVRWLNVYLQDVSGHQQSCSRVFGMGDHIDLTHDYVFNLNNRDVRCHEVD